MRIPVLVMSFLAALPFSAGAQKPDKREKTPDEQIKVEREYDKDGNLIRFDSLRVYNWSGDSVFNFPMDKGWEKLFGGEEMFRNFRDFGNDSVLFRDFLFRNDTSFFMGPNSSFLLPPGFFIPDRKGLDELQKLFDRYFQVPPKGEFPGFENQEIPFRLFTDPDQQKEWEELLEKQEQEIKNFREKWEKKKKIPGTEKM